MAPHEGKVLVIGDDTLSFLAIVRSLGRRGIVVHAAPSSFRSPSLRSRYIAALHELPPWMGQGAEWLDSITKLLRNEQYELVIPCNETSLLPLQRHREFLSDLTRLAIPSDRSIELLFDKNNTRKLAEKLGIPIAAGRIIGPDDRAQKLIAEFGRPIVIKPIRSYSLQNLTARGKVQVLSEQSSIDRLLTRPAFGDSLVEQCFTGNGVGISILASEGRILQAFEHHRAREVAGASFYRFSAPLTSELVRACELIVEVIEYSGIAMFEFKVAADGSWILLEVNARPWGSMPLPVALGVDFPFRWYQLLVFGNETPAVTYRTGIYCRNLLPDLRNSLIEAETRHLRPIATTCLMIRRLGEFRRLLVGTEVHDVLVRDDPRPGISELVQFTRGVLEKMLGAIPISAALLRYRARARVAGLHASGPVRRILFVCLGNICRSPFAEALLRNRLRDVRIAVSSAGTLPHTGRPTPAFGVEAAALYGIDLSGHRSAWLNRQMVNDATLLVVFDRITRNSVLDRYPGIEASMICLGDLTSVGSIGDPIDGDAMEFTRVYAQISAAVSELVPLLSKGRQLQNP